VVGDLELTYPPLTLSVSPVIVDELVAYTAEPGSTHEERIKLLTSWAATTALDTARFNG